MLFVCIQTAQTGEIILKKLNGHTLIISQAFIFYKFLKKLTFIYKLLEIKPNNKIFI